MNKAEALQQLYYQASKTMSLLPGAQRLVFGAGNADANLLFLGEAPGRHEDEKGIPFCGAAGRVLDHVFEQATITRDEVYITAVVKSRPPNNRKPTVEEKAVGRPLVLEQIKCIEPKVICTLGSTALEALLDVRQIKVTEMRGKPFKFDNCIVVPTYHPAHFLYYKNPIAMAEFVADLQLAKKLSEGIAEESKKFVFNCSPKSHCLLLND